MVTSAVEAPVAPINPWRGIWFHPQAAIRRVIERGPGGAVLALAIIGGISTVLFEAVALAGPADLPPLSLAVVCFGIGAVFGIVSLYVNAALIRITGALLRGKASFGDLRAALAWGQVPLIASLCIMLVLFGVDQVYGALPASGQRESALTMGLAVGLFIAAILQLWSFFLSIRTIGAVQSFSFLLTVVNLALTFVLILPLMLAVRVFAFQPYSIPSGSMAPTLMVGDYMFASKFAYGYGRYSAPIDLGFKGRILDGEPKRGDVVVFRLHSNPNTDYVKRVIGLPGDEVQVKEGGVVLNGQPLAREKLGDAVAHNPQGQMNVTRYRETLPDGRSYETYRSATGATFGDTGITYKVPAGEYFVLGDNRDNSDDSRFSRVGYIYHDDLVGRAAAIFYTRAEPEPGHSAWERLFRAIR